MWERWLKRKQPARPQIEAVQVAGQAVTLLLVHQPRARRYLLRVRPDGSVRVTIPRHGTVAAAREFAGQNIAWLEQALQRLASQPKTPARWTLGTEIFFRGERVRIEPVAVGFIRFGPEQLQNDCAADLRPTIEKRLRQLAAQELSPRVLALAARHGVSVAGVSVRNQKSRWGSCSRRGAISLNWRLIQTPDRVRDYIILHELAHRREMNHSKRFWQEVARLCPEYLEAERWLKQHSALLR